MNTTIKGHIKEIHQKEKHGSYTFRRVIIETVGDKPQVFEIQLNAGLMDSIDSYMEGERIAVDCELLGRPWTSPKGETKYFVTIRALSINKA